MSDQKGFNLPNPGIGFSWLIGILITIFKSLFPSITEDLKAELTEFLLRFYLKAMETTNPWDDFLARFFLRILSIPIPEGELYAGESTPNPSKTEISPPANR